MIKNKRMIIIVSIVVWVFVVGLGWTILSQYENSPGHAESSPQHWPLTSKIPRTVDLPTLVMFIHPHCPCSRASITELSLIMVHSQNKVRAEVVFIKPENFTDDWVKTDLWNSAAHIPGVETIVDGQGKEADIFHADVSGQTMLYDNQGKLVFSGGITSSRGHEGDNDGKDAIISFLTMGTITKKQTPFFGCLLSSKQKENLS